VPFRNGRPILEPHFPASNLDDFDDDLEEDYPEFNYAPVNIELERTREKMIRQREKAERKRRKKAKKRNRN
jgi:hypothetical protein